MRKDEGPGQFNRRNFLAGVAASSAAAAVIPGTIQAQAPDRKPAASGADIPADRGTPPPTAAQHQLEVGIPAPLEPSAAPNSNADFMVDVIKSLHIPYVFCNPGSSFRGLHESVINYGNNQSPELITCTHEEGAAAMANGYAKASGQPAAIFCHATVGLQHAAMALYNAWCDRVPMIVVLGNTLDGMNRHHWVEWVHSAQDPAALVRDFTKWDDQPVSLQGFAESLVRGYKISMTPPMAPVAIVVDQMLQEQELHDRGALTIPKLSPTIRPQGDLNAVREAARILAAAEAPVIVVDRFVRTPEGMRCLIELAESLGASVIDQPSRQNFPTSHPLCQSFRAGQLVSKADVIIGLEVTDFVGTLGGHGKTPAHDGKAKAKLITIGVNDLFFKSNYQDAQRYAPVDLSIAGDGETTLPSLLEEVRRAGSPDQNRRAAARIEQHAKAHAAAYQQALEAAAIGWNASPVSTARLCMELWKQIKNEDWALVGCGTHPLFVNNWPHRLWKFDRHYQFLGGPGGAGVGYALPAAVGAALANRALGRFSVNIQTDGDLMYVPGALWTAAHHKIPLLSVMHNNRAYGQETMLVQSMANRWSRGVDRAKIGTALDEPFIDYAKLAQSMGVWAEGPISDPKELAPAISRAIRVVKQGLPALVDVVTQTR